jgi:hypothetical protein
MSIPVGTSYPFSVVFYDDSGIPLDVSDTPTITVIAPDGTVTTSAGAQVGTEAVYSRSVTLVAGMYRWYGETTDPLASASTTGIGAILAASAASDAPTVAEIRAGLYPSGITLTSPLSINGATMTVVQGDVYDTDDARAFVWSLTNLTYSLVGATAEFATRNFSKVVTVDSGANTLTLELTAAETSALTATRHTFQVRVTLSGGNVVTPVEGFMNVEQGL